MARYIDADLMRRNVNNHLRDATHKESVLAIGVFNTILGFISTAPTENVASVAHGEWVTQYGDEDGHMEVICSSCFFDLLSIVDSGIDENCCRYCPSCGARMEA